MKRSSIRYTPTILVQFTFAEMELAMLCSENHYDGTCRDASAERVSYEGYRPGFLRGMLNTMRCTEENYEHEMTFRKLDTMLKCLEIASSLPAADITLLPHLTNEIRTALHDINQSVLGDVPIANGKLSYLKLSFQDY